MACSDKVSRFFMWFLAIVVAGGLWGTGHCAEGEADETVTANYLTNVAPLPIDHLSGSMPLYAIQAVLRTQGFTRSYDDFVAVSGSVFKVVYDSSNAFEPLRDACPFDLLRTVAIRSSFPDAHWEIGLAGEDLRRVVKQEIDAGRPLVSCFLKPDAYHGFNVITGYDYDRNVFKVQGGFDRRRAYNVPIPETWDGPTMSPAGWAVNPVFVLGEAADDSASTANIYTDMIDQGIELLRGGTVAYGSHPGEAAYMEDPGPREAAYGLPAYDIMAWDVDHTAMVLNDAGVETVNFPFLWRIDAMVGLIEHDRMRGPEFTSFLKGVVSQQKALAVAELVDTFGRTTEDAHALRTLFRYEIPDTLDDPHDIMAYADRSEGLVFTLPDREGLAENLRDMGRDVYESPWGWLMVCDSPAKRLNAKMRVISIRSRELRCLDLMKELADDLRARGDRPWPPRKWRPRMLKQE